MYYYFDRKIEEDGISIERKEHDPAPFNKLGISIKGSDLTYKIYFKKTKKTVNQDVLYCKLPLFSGRSKVEIFQLTFCIGV